MKYAMSLVTLLVVLQIPASQAQMMTTTYAPPTSAFGADPVIRIATAFRVAVAVNEGPSVPNMAAQELARRELYTMAAKECSILSETFKAECRLGSINTFAPTPAPSSSSAGSPVALGSINATANYELRPRATAQ